MRYQGKREVRNAYAEVLETKPDAEWGNGRHYSLAPGYGVSEWTLTGTSSDGRRVEANGCDFLTVRNGKILTKNSCRKQRPQSTVLQTDSSNDRGHTPSERRSACSRAPLEALVIRPELLFWPPHLFLTDSFRTNRSVTASMTNSDSTVPVLSMVRHRTVYSCVYDRKVRGPFFTGGMLQVVKGLVAGARHRSAVYHVVEGEISGGGCRVGVCTARLDEELLAESGVEARPCIPRVASCCRGSARGRFMAVDYEEEVGGRRYNPYRR